MDPTYIEKPYIIICWLISSHMGPMYIESPFIIISSRVSSSHTGPIYIETLYISSCPLLLCVLAL